MNFRGMGILKMGEAVWGWLRNVLFCFDAMWEAWLHILLAV